MVQYDRHPSEILREGLKFFANYPHFVDKGGGVSSNVDKRWEGGGGGGACG